MKRFLSLILSLALVLPCVSVWAADTDDLVLGSVDEVVSQSDTEAIIATIGDDINLEVNATQSVGYFEGGSATIKNREFFQDFESATPISYYNASTGKDSTCITDGGTTPKIYWTNQNDERSSTDPSKFVWNTLTYDTADALFKATGSTKYLTVRTTVAKKASGATDQIVGPWLTFKSMADGEKAHMSFYIKNDDFIYDKEVYHAKSNRTGIAMSLVKMGKNGIMTFGYATSPLVSVGYSLNRWYKIDLVFTHNESSNDTVDIYLDGKLMVTNEYSSLMDSNSGLIFKVVSKNVDYAGTSDSVLCVDDISAKMYAASETIPAITPRNFVYTNFDTASGVSTIDGFNGDDANGIFTYNIASGILGKESTDSSMKLTPASAGSADAYVLDMTNIKADGNFASGSQLKFSTSYAYKTGGGADSFMLEGASAAEGFFSIDRTTGVLSALGSSDTFTLASEKWYNLDTILTVNADNTLGYTINVNGIEEITGTLDIASLQGAGAVINKLIINSAMDSSAPGEAYLDDMYAEYFTGSGADIAEANAPIVNAEVDLAENGKIFIPAGYNVADLLSDTEGTVKVIRDGASVTSGTAEDALVIAGDLLPVYGYAYVKLKLNAPTAVFGTGTVTVSEDLISNQSEPIDLTLITAVYKDGKIYSVSADSKNCTTGTTTLSTADVAVPSDGTIKIFTTSGWDLKTPIFDDQVYTASASAPVTQVTPDSSAVTDAAAAFEAEDFDYDNLSVAMSGTIGNSGVKTAAVYIVEKDADISALSDGNLPIFADSVTTDSNGRFKLNVKFPESGTAFGYGSYDIYVFSKDLTTPYKDSFDYLSPAQILAAKKQTILDAVKGASTWQAMMAEFFGEDIDGNVVDAEVITIIAPDMTDYNGLNNKEQVFIDMFKQKSSIADFDDIADKFETIAYNLKYAQDNANTGGGSGGGGGGFSKPVMNTTPPKQEDSGNNQGAGSAAFSFLDMSGHWSEIYVKALTETGVISGYPDGTYGPDNSVTRAELMKIISVAFGIKGSANGEFGDVPSDSWYAPFVNGGANAGIVTGFGGNFNPEAPVTRQDAAVMLYRAIDRTHDLGMGYVFFADETSISTYAVENVSALAEIGIITGNEENRFMPANNLSRAEAAALISRAIDYITAH